MDIDDLDVSVLQPAASPIPTEVALAEEFATRHAQHLRYVAKWGSWMRYLDGRWTEEETHYAFDEARKVCVEFSHGLNKPSEIKTVLSAKTVAAIEKLAKADRRIAATVNQWDADPWLLNTPDGTVDLKTGKLRPHNPDDYITKMTRVAPGGKSALWKAHLERIFKNKAEVISFLQSYFGYSLTGDTSEHKFCFAWGEGANGKGTTIDTVAWILNDYHLTIPMETFMVTKSERIPTDIDMMRGARLITANETEAGRRWDEAKITLLTGGGKVTARFMRHDFFEFEPVCKFFFVGNKQPRLGSTNEAIRRRLNQIPFAETIPVAERDINLNKKLRREAGGILQWMIDGCGAWQRDGLQAPAAVRISTDEYLEGEDILAAFIRECCLLNPNEFTPTRMLYAKWRDYCEDTGEFMGSEKTFVGNLTARSVEYKLHRGMNKEKTLRGFYGIELNAKWKKTF